MKKKKKKKKPDATKKWPCHQKDSLSHSLQCSFLNTLGKMDKSHLDGDPISVPAPEKHKTTYPRDHLTENPKPPKRTKAEIQQAAKEKKEVEQVKKPLL